MGTSYNTGIVYGHDLGDLDGWDAAPAWMLDAGGSVDDWDPDDHLAAKLGWEPAPFPDHAYAGEPDWRATPEERQRWRAHLDTHPDMVAYRANQERKRMTLQAADYGCSIDSYGHAEGDLTLLIKVDASEVSSDIWTAKRLDDVWPHGRSVNYTEWNARLERYLDALEIPREIAGDPGWMLVGSVG